MLTVKMNQMEDFTSSKSSMTLYLAGKANAKKIVKQVFAAHIARHASHLSV